MAYGSIYHIIHQGKGEIFKESNNKLKFLECLGNSKEKYDFLLLGYCIMDDHYHIIIKALNISISKIMQSINTQFGKYYSGNYKETPFKGRYKRIVIKEDEVPELINIIHNKAIFYNLTDSMVEYPYTSHAFYLMNVDSFVDIDYLLGMLSSDRIRAIEEYSKIMDNYPKDYEELLKLYSKPKGTKKNPEKSLEEILREICLNQIDFELVKNGSKKAYLMEYKKEFIEEAKDLGYSTKEIGKYINISDRAVRKHIHIN